jgi:hypothetical protein
VTRLAHLSALVLALLVAWQPVAAALPGGMVCRFTGRVIQSDCPCPPQGGEQGAELARQSCCELRSAPGEAAPGEVPSAMVRVAPAVAALPAEARIGAQPVLAAGSSLHQAPDDSPPGRTRLFVRLRHLLI